MPYSFRRHAFRIAHPKKYKRLLSLRDATPEKLNGATFKLFLERRCLFVHVPKAAGISIGYGLFGRHTGNHTTVSEYQIAFTKSEFDGMFKFTFVRNPWDRVLSAFMFLKNGGRNKTDLAWSVKHLSEFQTFEDFVKGFVDTKNIYSGIHFVPQYRFVTTHNLKIAVDFVGRFESITEDYNHISDVLGFGSTLTEANKTREKADDYRRYYSSETADIVADAYKIDIELFGYNFE